MVVEVSKVAMMIVLLMSGNEKRAGGLDG